MSGKNKLVIRLVLAMVAMLYIFVVRASNDNGLLNIDFLDIGQGDSILITTPDSFQILVDGGPGDQVLESLQEVMALGDTTIEWLILTHPDADHLAGLIDVIENYRVDRVFLPYISKDTMMYKAFEDLIEERDLKKTFIVNTQEIKLGEELTMSILHPSPQTMLDDADPNDYSIVFKLKYYEMDFLFTGDIESGVEAMLVKEYGDILNAEVLKVPHHGSKSSSTPDFLAAVNPKLAIIQVSESNSFGHPHNRVTYRYNQLGAQILRTDQLGTIRLATDGQEIWQKQTANQIISYLLGEDLKSMYTIAN